MVTSEHLMVETNQDSSVLKPETFLENNLTLKMTMDKKTLGWTKQPKKKEPNKGLSYRYSPRRVRMLRQKLRPEIQNKFQTPLLCSM